MSVALSWRVARFPLPARGVFRAIERVRQWDQPTVGNCIACPENACTSTHDSVRKVDTRHRVCRFLSKLCSSHVSILCIECGQPLPVTPMTVRGVFLTASTIHVFCRSGVPNKKRRFRFHLSVAKNAVFCECGREDLNLHALNRAPDP